MENCCMNCKHFKIWDSDPCCLHEENWKIVLPSMLCNKHIIESFRPVLKLRIEEWNECKQEFFKSYTIDQQLMNNYLKMFPGDEELINKS